MKINRLEAHDRLLHFKKTQAEIIFAGAEECLKKNSLSLAYQQRSPYVYVYAHARTIDADEKISIFNDDLQKSLLDPFYTRKYQSLAQAPEKRLIWMPRLAKPKFEPNSFLFRAISHSDNLEMCWMLPAQEFWGQYTEGNVTESIEARWSIYQYNHKKKEMEMPHPDDLSDERSKAILLDIAREIEQEVSIKKLYFIKDKEVYTP